MRLQVDVLERAGVSAQVAKELMNERMDEVARWVMASNHMRSVDVARLLDLPFMCAHTPADNHVANFLQNLFQKSIRKDFRLYQDFHALIVIRNKAPFTRHLARLA